MLEVYARQGSRVWSQYFINLKQVCLTTTSDRNVKTFYALVSDGNVYEIEGDLNAFNKKVHEA